MLSLYLEAESRRWAAQQQSYPASPMWEDEDSLSDSEDTCSDTESIFSRGNISRSRRSSISSVASDEAEVAPAFEQPRDASGAPIAIYTSLDQAVAQSNQRIEAEGPRRLVTPGKLYENEEDDDEIVEDEDEQQQQQMQQSLMQYPVAAVRHVGSYTPPGVIAVG
ncbi:hypothetical protein F4821DRAFT_160346 [Hypoxylon rubiginosum]|uniref:Uncharacterized protein n=1 Tax=Hypoxylon rubiginosum TaxID=110542 RepID=A0ACC0DID0_9PEZI|nr:hypothetical protein F4821DRAFT_160346 [Hypoxylon rubiginosum]